MKIKVDAVELNAAMRVLKRVASRKATLPALQNVAIEGGDLGMITLMATDLTLWGSVRVKGEIVKPGKTAVDARLLAEAVITTA